MHTERRKYELVQQDAPDDDDAENPRDDEYDDGLSSVELPLAIQRTRGPRQRERLGVVGRVCGVVNLLLVFRLGFELVMNNDSLVSEELWTNAVVRPPLILIVLMWGWYCALAVCVHTNIDVNQSLIRDQLPVAIHVSVLKPNNVLECTQLCTLAFLLNCASHVFPSLPAPPRMLLFIALLLICMNPLTWMSDDRRFTVLWTLFDIVNPCGEVRFRHVLLADVLTSLSKTLVDLQVMVCVFGFSLIGNDNPLFHEQRAFDDCSHSLLAPLVMSLPFLFRFRQCLTVTWKGDVIQLFNALKYCSSLPVIAISTLKFSYPWLQPYFVPFAVVNSLYGFVWDCVFDWGLWSPQSCPPLLRSHSSRCLFPTPVYFAMMAVDGVLRFAWLLNLVPSFAALSQEYALFVFEVVEVVRRSAWIVLRVEWEVVRPGAVKVVPSVL